MEILNAIILGSIQGLTEFLPISSSGHLILARDFLGQQVVYGLAYDAILQLATTLAIIIYFHRDIWRIIRTAFLFVFNKLDSSEESLKQKKIMWAVVLGTIPAVVFGLMLESHMDTVFRNSGLIVITLLAGAVVMAFAERFAKQNQTITPQKGLMIGFFQSLALIPGMSRSGMAISGGLFASLNREESTRFAFIIAFPILIGSGLKKMIDLSMDGLISTIGMELIVGSLFAFIVGLAAIHLLINFLKKNTLRCFIWYRVILAVVIFIVYI